MILIFSVHCLRYFLPIYVFHRLQPQILFLFLMANKSFGNLLINDGVQVFTLVRQESKQLGFVAAKTHLLTLVGSFFAFMVHAVLAVGNGDVALISAVPARCMVLAILIWTAICMTLLKNLSSVTVTLFMRFGFCLELPFFFRVAPVR